jgi:hypothetical protein
MPLVKHFFPAFTASNTGMNVQWMSETNSQAEGARCSENTTPVNKDNSTTCLQLEEIQVPSKQK